MTGALFIKPEEESIVEDESGLSCADLPSPAYLRCHLWILRIAGWLVILFAPMHLMQLLCPLVNHSLNAFDFAKLAELPNSCARYVDVRQCSTLQNIADICVVAGQAGCDQGFSRTALKAEAGGRAYHQDHFNGSHRRVASMQPLACSITQASPSISMSRVGCTFAAARETLLTSGASKGCVQCSQKFLLLAYSHMLPGHEQLILPNQIWKCTLGGCKVSSLINQPGNQATNSRACVIG